MTDEIYQGKVKWFSNKAGYGFVTVTKDASIKSENAPPTLVNEEIFVHHSGINTEKQVYKFLNQEELVEFKVLFLVSDKHKYQAIDVKGVNGSPLKCELRINKYNRFNKSRSNYKKREETPVEKSFSIENESFPELPSVNVENKNVVSDEIAESVTVEESGAETVSEIVAE